MMDSTVDFGVWGYSSSSVWICRKKIENKIGGELIYLNATLKCKRVLRAKKLTAWKWSLLVANAIQVMHCSPAFPSLILFFRLSLFFYAQFLFWSEITSSNYRRIDQIALISNNWKKSFILNSQSTTNRMILNSYQNKIWTRRL